MKHHPIAHGGKNMLVLSRKVGERILIGEDIVVSVLASSGSQIRLGIEAPRKVTIQRQELLLSIKGTRQCQCADSYMTRPTVARFDLRKSR
jgi:carbon storage regulator CsrA